MPAAAVIPAPIAYIKVVAVKKLVVEFLIRICVRKKDAIPRSSSWELYTYFNGRYKEREFYFE